LLLIAREPVAAPPAVGLNFTWSVTAREGFRVSGKVAPETVKPVPLIVDELMVTAPVPVEVKVTGSVADEPSLTVPKLRLLTLTASVEVVPDVPVPLKGTTSVVCLAALLVIVSAPVEAAADFGVNVTFRVAVCFGLIVIGRVPVATLNPVPLMDAALMVNVAVPVEVIVTGKVAFEPTATLPKLSLVKLIGSQPQRNRPIPGRSELGRTRQLSRAGDRLQRLPGNRNQFFISVAEPVAQQSNDIRR